MGQSKFVTKWAEITSRLKGKLILICIVRAHVGHVGERALYKTGMHQSREYLAYQELQATNEYLLE
jgi:hypothetical protein